VRSLDEVGRLLEATPGPGLKYKAALSVAYGAGLRAGEVVTLRISDIDSNRVLIRVEQGKGRKDRYAMLSPQLLELLCVVVAMSLARLAVPGPPRDTKVRTRIALEVWPMGNVATARGDVVSHRHTVALDIEDSPTRRVASVRPWICFLASTQGRRLFSGLTSAAKGNDL
jgi:integrase